MFYAPLTLPVFWCKITCCGFGLPSSQKFVPENIFSGEGRGDYGTLEIISIRDLYLGGIFSSWHYRLQFESAAQE